MREGSSADSQRNRKIRLQVSGDSMHIKLYDLFPFFLDQKGVPQIIFSLHQVVRSLGQIQYGFKGFSPDSVMHNCAVSK